MTLRVYHAELGQRDGSSPVCSYTSKGNGTVTRTYKVRWADRHLACRQLIGYSYPETGEGVDPEGVPTSVRRLRRELPESYRDDRNMYCVSARVVKGVKWLGRTAYGRTSLEVLPGYPNKEPRLDNDNNPALATDWVHNVFKHAIIQAEFAQAKFSIIADEDMPSYGDSELARFTEYRDEREAKYQTIRQGMTYYVLRRNSGEASEAYDARRSIPFTSGVIEFSSTLFVDWHAVHVDAVPWTTIDGLVGKTSKTTFLNKPAGTLIFLPPKVERYNLSTGALGATISFTFGHFGQGQNKILFADPLTRERRYVYVTFDKGIEQDPTPGQLPAGKFLHDEDDFHKAFVCANP